MIQVWLLDENDFFTGESKFVDKLCNNMTSEPLTVGYIKAKWTGTEWVEGATDEEIDEWNDSQPEPSIPPKSNEELEQENKILKAQISALSSNQDFLEECIAEMAMMLYA